MPNNNKFNRTGAVSSDQYFSWSVFKPVLISASLSFVLVFIVGWLALVVSPIWTALVWSIPFGAIAIVFALWQKKSPAHRISAILFSNSTMLVSYLASIITWAVGISFVFVDKDFDVRVWGSLGIAMVTWLFINAIIIILYFCVPAFRSLMTGEL